MTDNEIERLANALYDENIERMEERPGVWVLKSDLSVSRGAYKASDSRHLAVVDTDDFEVLLEFRDALRLHHDRIGADAFAEVVAGMEVREAARILERQSLAAVLCPRCHARPTSGRKRDGTFKFCLLCAQETKPQRITTRKGRASARIANNSVKF